MRALQKLFHYGSVTAVTIPRTILRHLVWCAGDRVVEELTPDNTLLIRRPTEADIATIQHPTAADVERLAVLKLYQSGNTTVVTVKRDFLIRLGWLVGDHVIVETLEDPGLRIRPGRDDDIRILLGSTRLVESTGVLR